MEPSRIRNLRVGCSGWQYAHWRGWYDDRVYALMQKYKVALCLHDIQGSATGRLVVGPFIYVRFHHGTKKQRHRGTESLRT